MKKFKFKLNENYNKKETEMIEFEVYKLNLRKDSYFVGVNSINNSIYYCTIIINIVLVVGFIYIK